MAARDAVVDHEDRAALGGADRRGDRGLDGGGDRRIDVLERDRDPEALRGPLDANGARGDPAAVDAELELDVERLSLGTPANETSAPLDERFSIVPCVAPSSA